MASPSPKIKDGKHFNFNNIDHEEKLQKEIDNKLHLQAEIEKMKMNEKELEKMLQDKIEGTKKMEKQNWWMIALQLRVKKIFMEKYEKA